VLGVACRLLSNCDVDQHDSFASISRCGNYIGVALMANDILMARALLTTLGQSIFEVSGLAL
jgi:hypothetical protein